MRSTKICARDGIPTKSPDPSASASRPCPNRFGLRFLIGGWGAAFPNGMPVRKAEVLLLDPVGKGAASLPYRRRSAPKVDWFRLDGGLKREGARATLPEGFARGAQAVRRGGRRLYFLYPPGLRCRSFVANAFLPGECGASLKSLRRS
jgi:hypothetical protein